MGIQIPMGRGNYEGSKGGPLCGDLCKNGCADRDAVWVVDSGWFDELCIRWGFRSPHAKGQVLGERTCPACPTTLCRELCKNA